jgi:hypothetical protein
MNWVSGFAATASGASRLRSPVPSIVSRAGGDVIAHRESDVVLVVLELVPRCELLDDVHQVIVYERSCERSGEQLRLV